MWTPRIFLSFAVLLGNALAAQAQERGTYEQRMACTGDVMRLCGDAIPDTDRIVACLRQNTAILSNGCRAVFDTSANAQPANPRPGQPMPRARQYQQPPMQAQPAPPPRPYMNDDDD